ncbi:MAG: polysaccharide deacetylase family protein [Armatimonadetes bacterium]|nr:polysaccharide deacetylase family protein [Armatimonadota bacterium]
MPPVHDFHWPDGERAAVSLTLDDARLTQIDNGIPLLNTCGVRATFYASLVNIERRLTEWCEAVTAGHEVGNHSVHHPCSCNFAWGTPHVLEDYTLEQMEAELLEANDILERLVGVRPTTFGYPCGQNYVGRGEETRSYVPLVAKHFVAGRGFRDESCNGPACCDLAQLFGVDYDRMTFAEVKSWLDRTAERGGWLIFAGHEMCVEQPQGVLRDTLEQTCRYLTNPANEFWVDTVAKIGSYVRTAREEV